MRRIGDLAHNDVQGWCETKLITSLRICNRFHFRLFFILILFDSCKSLHLFSKGFIRLNQRFCKIYSFPIFSLWSRFKAPFLWRNGWFSFHSFPFFSSFYKIFFVFVLFLIHQSLTHPPFHTDHSHSIRLLVFFSQLYEETFIGQSQRKDVRPVLAGKMYDLLWQLAFVRWPRWQVATDN